MQFIPDAYTLFRFISDMHSGQLTQPTTMNDDTSDIDKKVPADTKETKEFLKTIEAYNEICQILSPHVPESGLPTYDEWCDYIDNDGLHSPGMLGYTPGISIPIPGQAMPAISKLADRVGIPALKQTGIRFDLPNADDVLRDVRQKVEQNVRQRVSQTASEAFEKFTDTGDGGTSKVDYQGGSRFNPTGLSQTLKPIDTSFNTDITFQGTTRYWQDGAENTGPLLIKSGVPGLVNPTSGTQQDTQLWDFIQGPLTMEWNTAIAKKITWTGRVKDVLTETNINSYINRCLSVCCTYYFWRSVIAFTDDPRNRNAGMDALRDQLTPTDYNNLFNLRREMMQSAIPPFVHEWCFYIMGTYRQNDLPTSPIMKIMPTTFVASTGIYFSGATTANGTQSSVTVARGHLSQLKEFNNLLARAIGDWGGIEPFEYVSSPRKDYDYTTFWTNANYRPTNATGGHNFPQIASESNEIVYNTHTDAVDGWCSAMVSPLVLDTGKFGVGLFHPWLLASSGTSTASASSTYQLGGSQKSTSCFIYNADSTAGFYPIEASQTYQAISGNTYTTVETSNVFHAFQKFGTERIILTSINALRQANFQFLELLYTKDLRNLGWSPGIRDGKTYPDTKSDRGMKRRRRGSSKKKGGSKSTDLPMKSEL